MEKPNTHEALMTPILRSLLAVLLLSSVALAQQSSAGQGSSSVGQGAQGGQGQPGGPRPGAPRTPPPEAVAACSGKSAGASCTFQHKDRTETGTCFTPDPSMSIACKPFRPPREENSSGAQGPSGAR
jgi:hypothetical protein